MLLSGFNLIFIHIPKTGGNSLSHLLLPFSDDHTTRRPHQDRWDRFGAKGAITTDKHLTLTGYRDRLGPDFNGYAVATCVRDPLDRAVSWYCSPHRWLVEPVCYSGADASRGRQRRHGRMQEQDQGRRASERIGAGSLCRRL